MSEEAAAPMLSTYQDDSTFEFAKVQSTKHARKYLGPHSDSISPEEYQKLISEYYSIEKIVEYLKQTGDDGVTRRYNNVTLQFPDNLIGDSAAVVYELQLRLGLSKSAGNEPVQTEMKSGNDNVILESKNSENSQRIWILADTSYSACCVDEVAAEHVGSDLVLHFGDACLNPVEKVDVAFVLGKPYLDLEALETQIRSNFTKDDKLFLMADAAHTLHLKPLYESLQKEFPSLVYADLFAPGSGDIIGYESEPSDGNVNSLDEQLMKSLRRKLVGGCKVDITDILDLRDWDLIHISVPSTPRHLQLTTQFNNVHVFDSDVGETGSFSKKAAPNLMRRYRNVHVARSAGTVGLLVNTLSLEHTKKLINTVAKKIKDCGKKHYIFVVGKPNVAKLANFANVDVWCILGCDQQGIIIDQTNEYFKPIVTPYELDLALSEEAWTGNWVTSFESILEKMNEEVTEEESKDSEDEVGSSEDEAPEFDPVTGTFVSNARPLRRLQHLQITSEEEKINGGRRDLEETSLVKKLSGSVVLRDTVSTSAIHLQNRTWTGLGSDFNEANEAPAVLEEGRGGVARGFEGDVTRA